MIKKLKINKGLNIKVVGKADHVMDFDFFSSNTVAVKPTDFHGIVPKLEVKVGDKVKAGDPLFNSKKQSSIKFVSPISGEVIEIERGAKRKILNIKIKADKEIKHKKIKAKEDSAENIKETLLESGCWPFIKQRPFDVIANPDKEPRSIYISFVSTSPLGTDFDFSLADSQKEIQKGIDVLSKLTKGKVIVCIDDGSRSYLNDLKNCDLYKINNLHPAENVSVHMNLTAPISKDETVWTINPQDLLIIGRLFENKIFDAKRVVALAGSEIENPKYYKTHIGVQISALVSDKIKSDNCRIISGDILTGTSVDKDGFLGYSDNVVCVIPEGNKYTVLGWLPFLGNMSKLSIARTFFSWMNPNKKYRLNTNLNGEERALVVTGEMEKVWALKGIYPMQLLKSIMAKDIEKMENLGIYEVAPEDFSLIDFVCTSKIEAQAIVREGLDFIMEEVG